MPTRVYSLFLRVLAVIFSVFVSSTQPTNAEGAREPGRLFILADQSSSMYLEGFPNIYLQVEGITDALLGYIPTGCGEITITYFAWGNQPGPRQEANVKDEASRIELSNFILAEARHDRGATNHALAWAEVTHLASPQERTAVVILTNGEGYFGVFEPIPGVVVYKVAILFPDAATYLREEFLPGTGSVYLISQRDQIRDIILEALTGLELECVG